MSALLAGYNVEIDIWIKDGKTYLGHDKPTYSILPDALEDPRLWCHAKNFEALEFMIANPKIHCFWHQNDFFTLTSRGYVWCYPDFVLKKAIIQIGEKNPLESRLDMFAGICSDYIENYKWLNS